MTLKTFSNKQNATLGMLNFTVRQNIGLVVLTVICMLLVCPGYLMLHINDTFSSIGAYSYEFNTVLLIFSLSASVASAVGVVVYNIINFMYLYSKKSSDVFHAVPLTRTQLLFSRGIAGIICTLVPLIVGYLSLICIALLIPKLIVDLEILAVGFFYNILIMLIAWAISLIFIVCAGTVFDFALSFGIVNIALLILPAIISAMADELLFGYAGRMINDFMKWFSPVYFAIYSMEDFINRAETFRISETSLSREPIFNSNEVTMLIVSLIIIIGLTVLSVILYNRRNAEKAGNAYAFKFLYFIANLLLSFEVAYGIGMIFSEFEYNGIFWLFAIVGALLSAVTFGAISERGFKTVKKSLMIGGGSVAGLIAVGIILSTGAFGFETRVPEISRIATVEMQFDGRTVNLSADFEAVTDFHKNLLKNYESELHKAYSSDGDFLTGYVNIDYTLKNGNKILRTYWGFPLEPFAEDMVEICKKEDVGAAITKVKLDKPKYISFSGHIYDGNDQTDDYVDYIISREDYINLLEIYKKENLKLTAETLSTGRWVQYNSWWESDIPNTYYDFYVGDNYSEFIAAVKDLADKYEDRSAKY